MEVQMHVRGIYGKKTQDDIYTLILLSEASSFSYLSPCRYPSYIHMDLEITTTARPALQLQRVSSHEMPVRLRRGLHPAELRHQEQTLLPRLLPIHQSNMRQTGMNSHVIMHAFMLIMDLTVKDYMQLVTNVLFIYGYKSTTCIWIVRFIQKPDQCTFGHHASFSQLQYITAAVY